jgi:hypothetical protein
MATSVDEEQGGTTGGPSEAWSVPPDFFEDVKFFVSGTLDDEVSLEAFR